LKEKFKKDFNMATNDASSPPPSEPNPAQSDENLSSWVADHASSLKDALFSKSRIDILNDVSVTITIEIGRATLKIRDLLNLTKGSVLELNKLAGDPVDVYANGKLIAIGNIITANGKYCVKLLSTLENREESDGK